MINIAHMNLAIRSMIAERTSAATNGRITFERAAKARFLITREIEEVALTVISKLAPFDIITFTEYLRAQPELLAAPTSDSNFQAEFERIVHEHILRHAINWLFEIEDFACRPHDIGNVLADIKLTASNFVELIPGTNTNYLYRYVDDFLADPHKESYARICNVVGECKSEMHRLVFRLDIANPPGACAAAQAWRRMVEIEDQLRHLSKTIPSARIV
jgi:hypothetical protein